MKQYLKLAGLNVIMDSFGRAEDYARPYEVKPFTAPDIIVKSDLNSMRSKYPDLSDNACEYMASGKDFYLQLLDFDGMMLHSSALVVDGRAYLFSADPGTGKSTHVCLWRRLLGDEKVRVLNDDKPAIRLENGCWYAYGTPWSGKTGQNLNLKAPLAGIAFIERGTENTIVPFSGMKAVQAFLGQVSLVETIEQKMKQMDLLDKLMTKVPIWKLKCNMEPEAAIVAYEAMSGQKYEGEFL